jgi:hypothetical protein
MRELPLAGHPPAAIDLNQPGNYLHWNIFTISVANLILIAVMVVIFGAALLLPFPHGRRADEDAAAAPAATDTEDTGLADPGSPRPAALASPDDRMWTARVRNWGLRVLPPGKLLPDRQPAYVASWIYVFGVAALAALGVVIVSGFAIALACRARYTLTRPSPTSPYPPMPDAPTTSIEARELSPASARPGMPRRSSVSMATPRAISPARSAAVLSASAYMLRSRSSTVSGAPS